MATIKININDLRTLISESVKKHLLTEIAIDKKYEIEVANGKTNLTYDIYEYICSLDPTTKNGNAGKYCNWLLKKFNVMIASQDSSYVESLRIALEQFHDGCKRGILQRNGISNDIGSYRSVEELVKTMNEFIHSGNNELSLSQQNHRERLKGQYDIVGESPNWYVVKPLTFDAERYFGSGTQWCTVGNDSYFKQYIKQGPLYITIPKGSGNEDKRMQFHFESAAYADVNDYVVDNPKVCVARVVGEGEDFDEICGMWGNITDKFNEYGYVKFRAVPDLLEHGVNYEYIFDMFDWNFAGKHIVRVHLNGKYNILNTKTNTLLFPIWFNRCDLMIFGNNKMFKVKLNEKGWNIINIKGNYLLDVWVDDVGDVYNGISTLCKQIGEVLKFNYFDVSTCNIIWEKPVEEWFDGARVFTENAASVKINDMGYNLVNKKGKFICKQWYQYIGRFMSKNCRYATVQQYDKWNWIDDEGHILLPKKWFDYVKDFISGVAYGYLNGQIYAVYDTGHIEKVKQKDIDVYKEIPF